jgi:hypothetical protein
MRIICIATAGALAALACVGPALALAPPAPEPMAAEAAQPASTGRAHLVFRADDASPVLEGRVTVIQGRTSTVVVEEISTGCTGDCPHPRLAMAAPATPAPPSRE